ncbi:MAG: hypothetical protein ACREIU_08440, partial [Planctomycetota bacterium]
MRNGVARDGQGRSGPGVRVLERASLAAALLGGLPQGGLAQEEPTTRSVERRLEDLERENRELRARLEAIERIGAAGQDEGLDVESMAGP